MTKATKKTTKVTKFTAPATTTEVSPINLTATVNDDDLIEFKELTTLGLTKELTKAITILASAIIFASPAYATQANPKNIVSLADLFSRYVGGEVTVQHPSDEVANANVQAASGPMFG